MKKIMLGLLFATSTASADFFDGNRLLERLNSQSAALQMMGMGYAVGVFDVYSGRTICAPSNANAGQITDMVHQWLISNPALRDLPAEVLVEDVLATRWPCETKKKRGGSQS